MSETAGRERPSFLAMVTAFAEIDGEIKRWLYEVQGCRIDDTTSWIYALIDLPEARVLTNCVNDDEADNTASNWGGIDPSTLPEGFDLSPIPVGAVVRVFYETATDGTVYGSFARENKIGGTC